MSEDIIANMILALQQHPTLALLFVFLIAFGESLIVVGLIVPGAILMVLFGVLIAMNALEFWPTVIVAVCGAIAGDGLSYWLGRRYQNKLQSFWPLSRYPDLSIRANQFFQQHGVKSIILSRFIGPLRPLIPAIAGITQMPVKIFITANISSAIAWAPLYLLPGILFGLSFEMASEFASKFILLIVFLLFIIFVSLWFIQRLYILIKPYNNRIITYLLSWGEKHSLAGEVPNAIFNQAHPELRGLSLVAFIIFSTTLFLSLLHNTLILPYNLFPYDLSSIDNFIYNSLQTFRSPPFDRIALWLNYLSSSIFIALLYFSLGSLFILKKNFFTLWHWLAAIVLPLLLSPILSNNLIKTLQQSLNINISSLPFVVIISTLGFLSIIISSELSSRKQKLVYYFSATLILTLMLAQLYFATQVFSQVLFGFIIGVVWFNLLGIAYRRHNKKNGKKTSAKEIILIIIVLLIYPTWKTLKQKEFHSPSKNYFVMGTNSWLESGWKLLPNLRQGVYLNKDNLFNLQWLASEESINAELSKLGFINSSNATRTLSNWLLDDIEVNQLPVLPHMHKGKYETLRFYRYNKTNQELIIIRLWPSQYKLKQDNPLQPLWFGSISFMVKKENLGFTYLVTKKEKIREIKMSNKNLITYEKIISNETESKNNTIFLVTEKL